MPPELRELMYASPVEPQVDSLVVRLFHELEISGKGLRVLGPV